MPTSTLILLYIHTRTSVHKKALAVTVSGGGDDGARADNADEIEAEDLAGGGTFQDMLDNDTSSGCKCVVS